MKRRVIEADYLIDLGPEGGHAGGEVGVTGTPEEIAACQRLRTGGDSRRLAGVASGCFSLETVISLCDVVHSRFRQRANL